MSVIKNKTPNKLICKYSKKKKKKKEYYREEKNFKCKQTAIFYDSKFENPESNR